MWRYVAKFSKGKGIKFISHLDLMRTMERAIRRAGIPITYSKGFNPHMELSFATPLGVGTWSKGEYMDFKLDYEIGGVDIIKSINAALPADIRFISVKQADERHPSLMTMVDAALYEITLVCLDEACITHEQIENFMGNTKIEVLKEGKNGSRIIDIKPMIYNIELLEKKSSAAVISTITAAGSKSNLNPEVLVMGMKKYIGCAETLEIRDICKIDTYVKKGGVFASIMDV